jgi:hypothetical protein
MCSKPVVSGWIASCAAVCLLLTLPAPQARAQSASPTDGTPVSVAPEATLLAPEPARLALAPSEVLAAAAAPSSPLRTWYGYQIMAADLTSVGLGIFGGQAAVGGLGVFVLPPAIHGLHGRTGLAIASPLFRLGLPLLGLAVGRAVASCSPATVETNCGQGDRMVGLGLGVLTAMVLDWTLAWQTLGTAEVAPASPSIHPVGVQLTAAGLAPSANGATLILGGSF